MCNRQIESRAEQTLDRCKRIACLLCIHYAMYCTWVVEVEVLRETKPGDSGWWRPLGSGFWGLQNGANKESQQALLMSRSSDVCCRLEVLRGLERRERRKREGRQEGMEVGGCWSIEYPSPVRWKPIIWNNSTLSVQIASPTANPYATRDLLAPAAHRPPNV